MSFVLLLLGSSFGLAAISLWGYAQLAVVFAFAAVIWLVVTQWFGSGLGGYLTGRLRTKWVGMHTQEVFFRDSAHGFMTWAVATLLMVYVTAISAAAVTGRTMETAATT